MKKLALALISAAALVFGFGVVANAQYLADGSASSSPANPGAGGDFDMTLQGCYPPEVVNFALFYEGAQIDSDTDICVEAGTLSLGSIIGLISQAAGTGSATGTMTLGTAPGTYTAVATGAESGATATLTFVVAATDPGGGLPPTGSDGTNTTTGIAIGLLVMGLGLFGVAQFRRRQTHLA